MSPARAGVKVGRAQIFRKTVRVPERGIGVSAVLLAQELVEAGSFPAPGVALLIQSGAA